VGGARISPDFHSNFDENSESTVDGTVRRDDRNDVTIVIRRPGIPICFLHVADPWAAGLQFSRPGRARTLSWNEVATCRLTILQAPS
jgi:hypothetical protein